MFLSHRTTRRRKLPSHAKVRSTFHLLLYLRSCLPSCVGFLILFCRCGLISSMSLAANCSRRGSLSYPLSAISLSGFRFGSPPPLRGTATLLSVFSTSVTSFGLAESRCFPIGIPSPSTTTIHFVPLPRLVFPTHSPLFWQGRNCRR